MKLEAYILFKPSLAVLFAGLAAIVSCTFTGNKVQSFGGGVAMHYSGMARPIALSLRSYALPIAVLP